MKPTPSERFVKAWQTSSTVQQVADKLGVTKAIAASRSANYRKSGVKLKRMANKGGRPFKLDIPKLNALAAQYLPKGSP